jgi:hypothetical protein
MFSPPRSGFDLLGVSTGLSQLLLPSSSQKLRHHHGFSQAHEAAERYAWLDEKATPRTIKTIQPLASPWLEVGRYGELYQSVSSRLGIFVPGSASRGAGVSAVVIAIPRVCELALLRGRPEML